MDANNETNYLTPLQRNALRYDVVMRLMRSIFQGSLPAGSHLVIRKMAEQMGVSATPIREALLELEAIGIVQFSHHRGAVVKEFGPQQIREIYHLRRILESEAVRCACGRIPRDELEKLDREMDTALATLGEDSLEWMKKTSVADIKLHELTALYCGNSRLVYELDRYETLMQTVRGIIGNRRGVQERAMKEHAQVVKSLLANDAEAAAARMADHIDGTLESVLAVMFHGK
jgi:DNA-binding GntR family transcriptional regulator